MNFCEVSQCEWVMRNWEPGVGGYGIPSSLAHTGDKDEKKKKKKKIPISPLWEAMTQCPGGEIGNPSFFSNLI